MNSLSRAILLFLFWFSFIVANLFLVLFERSAENLIGGVVFGLLAADYATEIVTGSGMVRFLSRRIRS